MPLLLCDLDGTLIDRAGAFRAFARDLADRYRQDDTFVDWVVELDNEGFTARADLYVALSGRIAFKESAEEFVSTYPARLSNFVRPDPTVSAALERARKLGWSTAVVTNGDHNQRRKIAAARLEPFFDVVCMSAVEDAWKPDPRLLEIAAQRVGTDLRGAWLIGDSAEADIGAACNAGISSVWLRNGRRWQHSTSAPTHEADSFAAAVELILAGT